MAVGLQADDAEERVARLYLIASVCETFDALLGIPDDHAAHGGAQLRACFAHSCILSPAESCSG